MAITEAQPAAAAAAWPAHVSAPYVDTGLNSTTLTTVASATGDKYFTLAFVDGAGCAWALPNESSWASQTSSLQSAGGDVSVSFGGYTTDTNGTDLGNTCSSASAMATQVENAITTLNVTHVDFDIESNELTNSADYTRTAQALALVRTWGSNNGRALKISYTIPVFPSGLTSDGLSVLHAAASNNFTPDVVNIMTMDYGTSGTEMGAAANQALDAVAGQVASTFGLSTAAAYAKLGNTPMIGQNDSSGEVFTLADAATVEQHAAAENIALLSFWSEGRDNGGCPGTTTAQSTCSGISQNTYDFTDAFEKFTGGSSGGGGSYPTGYHQLVVQNSKLCVDVAGNSTANDAVIDQWTCKTSGQANQEFQFNPVSGGYGELQNQLSGKDIVVQGASTASGAKIIQYTQNGTTNGLWLPIELSNGTWQFKNDSSGLCLDQAGDVNTTGVQFDQWPCKSGTGNNQDFAVN